MKKILVGLIFLTFGMLSCSTIGRDNFSGNWYRVKGHNYGNLTINKDGDVYRLKGVNGQYNLEGVFKLKEGALVSLTNESEKAVVYIESAKHILYEGDEWEKDAEQKQ